MSNKYPFSLKSYRIKVYKTKIIVFCREEDERSTCLFQVEFKRLDDYNVILSLKNNKYPYEIQLILERAGFNIVSWGEL